MTTPQLAAAHIITADATGLGDPEILIMTRDDGTGAELVERHFVPDSKALADDLGGALFNLGWRPMEPWTQPQPGYWIVNVERDARALA